MIATELLIPNITSMISYEDFKKSPCNVLLLLMEENLELYVISSPDSTLIIEMCFFEIILFLKKKILRKEQRQA